MLALVYIFTAYPNAPVLRRVHRVGRNAFLARLGRQSLPVFTFGAIYALLANELLNTVERAVGRASPMALAFEVAVIVLGLMAMGCTERRRWPLRLPRAAPERPHAAPIAAESASRA